VTGSDQDFEVLKVDNAGVRAQQLEMLRRLREERNDRVVDAALQALTDARHGDRRRHHAPR
jgi:methylmalonyl-CoA mutase